MAGADVIDGASGRILATTDRNGRANVRVVVGERIVAIQDRTRSAPTVVTTSGATIQLTILATIATTVSHSASVISSNGEDDVSTIALGGARGAARSSPISRSPGEGGMTSQSVDGVALPDLPVASAGVASSMTLFPSDLVTSTSLSTADDGTVNTNMGFLKPSDGPVRDLDLAASQFDGSSATVRAADRVNGFGYAIQLGMNADEGALDGYSGRDTSGLIYNHASDYREFESSLDLEYARGATFAQIVGFSDTQRQANVNRDMPGSLPLGVGPGNSIDGASSTGWVYLRRALLHGDALSYLDVHYGGDLNDGENQAFIAGIPEPSESELSFWGASRKLQFVHPTSTGDMSLYMSRTTTQSLSTFDESGFTGATGSTDVGLLWNTAVRNTKYHVALSSQNSTGFLHYGGPSVSMTYVHSNGSDEVYAELFRGAIQSYEVAEAAASTFIPAIDSSITCSPQTATAQAPSVTDGRQPVGNSAIWHASKTISRVKVTAGGYASVIQNGLARQVASTASHVPAGYAASLAGFAQYACQSSAVTHVLYQSFRSVPQLLQIDNYVAFEYRSGIFLTRTYVESLRDVATSIDPAGTASTIIPWTQLQGVPKWRSNLLLGLTSGQRIVGVDVAYEGTNNENHIPGYVTVGVGARLPAPHGYLQFDIQNLFGTYADRFATTLGATSFSLDGMSVPYTATPIDRTWSVSYRFAVARRSRGTSDE
ncbi:MAG TPA: hypothetical protein VMF11_10925 [Candidatus Baltobacteraceae bacterium]|nr:hypothetical protein [Candidatus Baltobacteraceae bacterium]